jgi:hypothetical protein
VNSGSSCSIARGGHVVSHDSSPLPNQRKSLTSTREVSVRRPDSLVLGSERRHSEPHGSTCRVLRRPPLSRAGAAGGTARAPLCPSYQHTIPVHTQRDFRLREVPGRLSDRVTELGHSGELVEQKCTPTGGRAGEWAAR